MFIIELLYKAPLAQIDGAMRAHMKFVNEQYAAGTFLMSGRKIPRDGGVILAMGQSREQVEALAQQDPFVVGGLADVRITEFRVSQRAPSVDALLSKE